MCPDMQLKGTHKYLFCDADSTRKQDANTMSCSGLQLFSTPEYMFFAGAAGMEIGKTASQAITGAKIVFAYGMKALYQGYGLRNVVKLYCLGGKSNKGACCKLGLFQYEGTELMNTVEEVVCDQMSYTGSSKTGPCRSAGPF